MRITERKLRSIIRSVIRESSWDENTFRQMSRNMSISKVREIKEDFSDWCGHYCNPGMLDNPNFGLYHLLNDPHSGGSVDISYNIERLQDWLDAAWGDYIDSDYASGGGMEAHSEATFLKNNVNINLEDMDLPDSVFDPLASAIESRNCMAIGRETANLIFKYMLNQQSLSSL